MNADSGMMNTDSGDREHRFRQAERSSVAARSWDLFPARKVLNGSHEATDETTPRTTPPQIRRRPEPPGDRAGVYGGAGDGDHLLAAGDGRGPDVAPARRTR